MNIIGANVAQTGYGMALNDGGAALVIDGKVEFAISEERLTRKKYDSGFRHALPYVLDAASLAISDIDLFVFSSCSEPQLGRKDPLYVSVDGITTDDIGIPRSKIITVDHHLSHACSAYLLSPFEEAVILVIDGEGNVIGPMQQIKGTVDIMSSDGTLQGHKDGIQYWKSKLSRQSQFIGSGNLVQELHKDILDIKKTGMAEMYRYFTTLLGFGAYVNAGKLMGLSAYGNAAHIPRKELLTFNSHTGVICSAFHEDYENPQAVLLPFLREAGLPLDAQREPNTVITKRHEDMALYCQKAFSEGLEKKVAYWISKTGLRNVCISGGGALNSVANGFVRKELGINFFVPYAPGDSGQAIGNALFGAMLFHENIKRDNVSSPFLGVSYSKEDIKAALSGLPKQEVAIETYESTTAYIDRVVDLLAKDQVIGWFQSRSESGPRALGNRSILASPAQPWMKDRINRDIKYRESFRPFAPAVPTEYAETYFNIHGDSPYMSYVENVQQKFIPKIPAITHIDHTARLQTVDEFVNPLFHQLLCAFGRRTGLNMLLNTSFNVANEPIVETPTDAIKTLLNCGLDGLAIGEYIIVKKREQHG